MESDAPTDGSAAPAPARRSRWGWPHLAPLVLLLIGVGYALSALRLPLQTPVGLGPGFVPLLIALLMVGSSIWALLAGVSAVAPDSPFPLDDAAVRVPLLLGLLLAYIVLLNPAGHLIAGSLVASAALWVLGRRPWWAALGYGLLLAVGSWVLFDLLLALPLPAGPFG